MKNLNKKILIIVPYPKLYPPMNGGMLRCFNIVHQLTKFFDTTLITYQKTSEFLKSVDDYPEIRLATVFSTSEEAEIKDIFRFLPAQIANALRYRWYKKQWHGPTDGNFIKYYHTLRRVLKQQKFDTIILENMGTLNAASVIRNYQPGTLILYDAHNVETNLASDRLKLRETTNPYFPHIVKAESTLHCVVDKVIACSEKDRLDFLKMNEGKINIEVIPNGIGFSDVLYDQGVREESASKILFCGSMDYPPNSEAVLWFYHSIWPIVIKHFPSLQLLIVGGGKMPEDLEKLRSFKDILFTGQVADVRPFYDEASLSIVPLKSGSGTRLKILEAMSYGVPVVATSKGAEGIEYTDDADILIADSEERFAEKVISLLRSRILRMDIQQRARALISAKYDWNVIGHKLADFINDKKNASEDAAVIAVTEKLR